MCVEDETESVSVEVSVEDETESVEVRPCV